MKSTYSLSKSLKSFLWTLAPMVIGLGIEYLTSHPEWAWVGVAIAVLRLLVDKWTHPTA